MPQRAIVTSVDALEAFRATLILYVSKARPTLEEVSAEVLRTRVWLENEQRTYWENQLRMRTRVLEQAQQALFGARLSNLRDESAAEVMAVHRAKRARDDAEAKLKTVKHWNREFDGRVQPLVKQMEKLHTILANDLTQAVVYLAQAVRTLDAYAGIKPQSASAEPGQTGGQAPAEGANVPAESETTP